VVVVGTEETIAELLGVAEVVGGVHNFIISSMAYGLGKSLEIRTDVHAQ
jgi:hypothetical protein